MPDTTQTTANNRPHATVATIVEREGRYLMVKELRDNRIVYNQPAGHIEGGESLTDAAVRETLEETGWQVRPIAFGGLSLYHAPNGITYLRSTLIAEAIAAKEDAQLDQGIIEAVWLSYEELLELQEQLRSPIVLKVIDDYRLGVRYPLELLYQHR
ncbi:NUDIX hydrolase [Pseudomaricurvus sp. HS19]|uniref:NUDIX hydrolase n=1 Tax=Pseudomaricurvus sp. HS19 TaxID=2692626 RepID=UPI001371C9B3|nr:NUDIX hydrolase [Pseudomaricurvus sp. HS19]MYM62216.1 NUDIX domain-containing protein [Pseudomaricurvus sp. HS19]